MFYHFDIVRSDIKIIVSEVNEALKNIVLRVGSHTKFTKHKPNITENILKATYYQQ